MPSPRFSAAAEADLLEIGAYTQSTWGDTQCVCYLDELEACCQKIADHPLLGRPCDYIRRGLRRTEHDKHVIFYRVQENGILVSRILHQRMLPEKHSIDDE